jgi:hypothetical protein
VSAIQSLHDSTPARRLARAIGDFSAVVGISEDGDEIDADALSLIAEPVGWYLNHPWWPSRLSLTGVPVEVSVSLDASQGVAVRWTVDVTDLRQGPGNNWGNYLKWATGLTGASDEAMWRLLAGFFNETSPSLCTPVVHGVGHGSGGRRRATIYVSSEGRCDAHLHAWFPPSSADPSELGDTVRHAFDAAHGLAYDFEAGRVVRTKFYTWLPLSDDAHMPRVCAHADLIPALTVLDAARKQKTAEPLCDRSVVLQASFREPGGPCRLKAIFMSPSWRWDQGPNFRWLVGYLGETFGLDLAELYAFLATFRSHGILLQPTSLAVGSGTPPSLTFYFCPLLHTDAQRVTIPAALPGPSARMEALIVRANEYVQNRRRVDGTWPGFAGLSAADEAASSAYIAAVLSRIPSGAGELAASARWLLERLQASGACRSRELTADALMALGRLGASLPGAALVELSDGTVEERRCPETTAALLFALSEIGTSSPVPIIRAATDLVAQQRLDGGWSSASSKYDLWAVYRCLTALDAFFRYASDRDEGACVPVQLVQAVSRSVRYARYFVLTQAVPDEPCALGLWLGCLFAAKGTPYHPGVPRILQSLEASQQPDGRWLSGPMRRRSPIAAHKGWKQAGAGILMLDEECVVTTAIVMDGLLTAQEGLGEGQHSHAR